MRHEASHLRLQKCPGESRRVCGTSTEDSFSSLFVLLASRGDVTCQLHVLTPKFKIPPQKIPKFAFQIHSEVDWASLPWSLLASHAAVFSITVASSQCPDFYPCPLQFVLKPEAIELCLKHNSEPLLYLIPSLPTWSNRRSCRWTAQPGSPQPSQSLLSHPALLFPRCTRKAVRPV